MGVAHPEGHLILTPPGQCLSKCSSKLEPLAAPPRGNSRASFSCTDYLSGVALRTRYVQLLSGFVSTSGGFAGLVLPLSKCLLNRDSETDRVFREKVYPSLTVRAYDGLSWDTPAGYYLSKAVPAVMRQMGIC